MPLTPLNNPNGQKKAPFKFSLWWMYAIVLLSIAGILYFDTNTVTKEVSYSEFGKIRGARPRYKKIVVLTDKREVEGFLTDSLARVIFKGHNIADGQNVVAKSEIQHIVGRQAPLRKSTSGAAQEPSPAPLTMRKAAPTAASCGRYCRSLCLSAYGFLYDAQMAGAGGAGGGGGIFSVGKSKAMLSTRTTPRKSRSGDVAGLSEAKTEIEEIVKFSKIPNDTPTFGGKIPKGRPPRVLPEQV